MNKNRSEWIEILDEAGVPCGPINKINEVWDDPQIKYRKMRIKTSHPKTGEVDNIGVVSKFLENPSSVRSPAPTLGEHTEKVLEDFGFDKNKYNHAAAGDINNDGFTDVVVAITRDLPYYEGAYIQILINNGAGELIDMTNSNFSLQPKKFLL